MRTVHILTRPPCTVAVFLMAGVMAIPAPAVSATADAALDTGTPVATGTSDGKTLNQTLSLEVRSGGLKTTRPTMGSWTETGHGTRHASLNMAIHDHRGSFNGWSLTASFEPTMPATALAWSPTCRLHGSSDDTVTTGTPGLLTTTSSLACATEPGTDLIGTSTVNLEAGLTLTGDVPSEGLAGIITYTIS